MELTDAIDRFRGPLVGLLVSWGASHVDAVELAQESLADAYLNRDRCLGDLQAPEIFGRWLRGIARNNFRNWRRSRQRREKRVVSMDPATLDQTVVAKVELVNDLLVADLRLVIDKLPTKQRQVIMMHYIEETSVKDVAALLSVSAKTVEGRLYQARRGLRRMLDKRPLADIAKALML